ncbi:hypothetical protein PN36_14400 [Candidatus Thiomargarita nelsonii]|uniref:Uncharacterized protein n=1 Tax=Candidatus Thiomargarita nelsonii TaxID=1003181 RepID=A0A0A6S1F8_9GAMM|nr:hypothetical protein PN36_14400 [Candidatus Thiomargarita nelsonii]
MKYDEIAELCEELDYRDKLRLAQLLIQLARKEEENQNPKNRISQTKGNASEVISDKNVDSIEYVAERLLKSKPAKIKSLEHFISSMFQFQGGISEPDKMKIISELQRLNYIKIDSNNRVIYK